MTLPHSYSFEAIGTHWSIDTLRPLALSTQKQVDEIIERFDQFFSRFRADSVVTQIAQTAGIYVLPAWAEPLWDFYEQMYYASGGLVTPMIGDALARAGYDPEYSLKPNAQSAIPRWEDAMRKDGNTITVTQPAMLDVGAAGKGFLVDQIAELLEGAGQAEYVIDASGDICHKGNTPEKVGLEDPNDPSGIVGTILLRNNSLCASASNRRRWGKGMHHLFDPRTVAPTEDVIATWAVAQNTMTADGIATALFFCDPDTLHSLGDFDFLRINNDGTLDYSKVFERQLLQ